jgi:hypothetical protein
MQKMIGFCDQNSLELLDLARFLVPRTIPSEGQARLLAPSFMVGDSLRRRELSSRAWFTFAKDPCAHVDQAGISKKTGIFEEAAAPSAA